MSTEMIIASMAFFALVIAWVVLPTGSAHQPEECPSEVDLP